MSPLPGNCLRDAALAYAAMDWPVFPLMPGDKGPLIGKDQGGRGVHDATTDLDQIRAWWEREPRANIGLAAGHAFWVLDVDYEGWEARAIQFWPVCATWCAPR